MTAITYRNTKTTIPRWVEDLHIEQPFGYAYESKTYFAKSDRIDPVSPVLRYMQAQIRLLMQIAAKEGVDIDKIAEIGAEAQLSLRRTN